MRSILFTMACLAAMPWVGGNTTDADEPIRIHPDNPRWLQWQGKTTALITSAEHYGAVLNQDFDFARYLKTLSDDGMNYTRIFAGAYVEPSGAFNIQRNTLAPAEGKFLAPWARSDQPGYAGGGNKFDLGRYSPEYLDRMKKFLREAKERGIVVELTLFCSTYTDKQWAVHPFNPVNNIQALPVGEWKKLHTLPNEGPAFAVQEKLVRYLVKELNEFDNLFFEIQNEPWSDNHFMGPIINPYLTDKKNFPNAVEVALPESVAWQKAIACIIREEESKLPNKHLIAQNTVNFLIALREEDVLAEADIIHFHYAYPEAAEWNLGFKKVIGSDETGFAGRDDTVYRKQAWNFLFAGGGIFNHLDYSFSVGKEDGTDVDNSAPGGGSPTVRKQFKFLSKFLHVPNLAELSPDPAFVVHAPGMIARTLSAPGKVYLLYVEGKGPTDLEVKLPAGKYSAEWFDVLNGKALAQESIQASGEKVSLKSPAFSEGAALSISLE